MLIDYFDDSMENGMVDVIGIGEGNEYLTLKVPADKMNKRYYTPEGN